MDTEYFKIVNIIKEIASTVIQNGEPMEVIVGEVVSASPLEIKIDPKLTIPEENIVLTKNTSEWTMEMSVDHVTENRSGGGGYAEFASHNHEYKGRKKYLVHNQLVVGDKVIMLKETGGQRYIALDRWYNPNRGCTTK
ncbi:DUF2577 domain-containing protein [Veillonella parvula]|jgi:hypothetical protein|uniref:DUF2577 domain-containing protein n=1 Tax=Veillonella parvula TaxID=29466 RepID=UPI0019614343|nr:DUF2577 domain-containing protein [Veillonella parvula]VTY47494.1 Uncharacterised protein [Veillonella parvula]